MTRTKWRALADLLQDATSGDVELAALADVMYSAVARYIPFDFACFATTDPATGLVTWASKTRSLGVGDEEFAAVEHGPPDINRFTELAGRTPPAGALFLDTGGNPQSCRRHRTLMLPRFGFTDELRVVFLSRGVSWGAMALYRAHQDPPFTAEEVKQLGKVGGIVGNTIPRILFRAEAAGSVRSDGASRPGANGQAVLIVDRHDQVTRLTSAADPAITELGGWDHGSLPASVLAVVAATRAQAQHTDTLVHASSGRWLTLRAAPLASSSDPGGDVVVTIDSTPRAALSRLALSAHGLTAREEDVALLVLQGASTEAIATALHLSPHTVQDHLKKIFTKLGVTSRRDLTARLT